MGPIGKSTEPFEVVRLADPAVDQNANIDWSTYSAERSPKLLKFHPGQQPVIFHCRPLTMLERRQVKARRAPDQPIDGTGRRPNPSTPESREMAFRLGLMKVTRMVHADGGSRDWQRPDGADIPGAGASANPIPFSAMEDFGDSTIDDVGGVIEARSFLDRDQPLVCPRPAISEHVQAHLMLHRAVRMRGTSTSNPSSAPPAAASTTPSDTAPSSPPGDASGDATATASPTEQPDQ